MKKIQALLYALCITFTLNAVAADGISTGIGIDGRYVQPVSKETRNVRAIRVISLARSTDVDQTDYRIEILDGPHGAVVATFTGNNQEILLPEILQLSWAGELHVKVYNSSTDHNSYKIASGMMSKFTKSDDDILIISFHEISAHVHDAIYAVFEVAEDGTPLN